MHENNEPKRNRRTPFYVSYGIALLIILLLNTFLFPAMTRARIRSVDYGTFLTMLEEGKLSEVQLEKARIAVEQTTAAKEPEA